MLSVVVPTYQEAENIVPLCEALLAVLHAPDEIIVVDDASADGTAARALPADRIYYGYGDYFFRLLFHAACRGASFAWHVRQAACRSM